MYIVSNAIKKIKESARPIMEVYLIGLVILLFCKSDSNPSGVTADAFFFDRSTPPRQYFACRK